MTPQNMKFWNCLNYGWEFLLLSKYVYTSNKQNWLNSGRRCSQKERVSDYHSCEQIFLSSSFHNSTYVSTPHENILLSQPNFFSVCPLSWATSPPQVWWIFSSKLLFLHNWKKTIAILFESAFYRCDIIPSDALYSFLLKCSYLAPVSTLYIDGPDYPFLFLCVLHWLE